LENRAPSIWVFEIRGDIARSVRYARAKTSGIKLTHICHNSRSEDKEELPAVCLSLERGAQRIFLPGPDPELQINDRLLFAGRDNARRQMHWTLLDAHSLMGNITGKQLPRGVLWRWLSER